MKCLYIFTLVFCLIFLGVAAPVTSPSNSNSGSVLPQHDKGKGRPGTPTPEDDASIPLPGRTGSHINTKTKMVTMHYGDDKLPEHMGHLQRNQAEFPHNRSPMSLSTNDNNRANALHNIPPAVPHPITQERRVRDEKMPNMLHNPNHATSTTVEYLPDEESRKEGGHLKNFKKKIRKLGPNAQGQLRPNPGWLPLHPDQQRGHEAPARLNSQTYKKEYKPKKKAKSRKRPQSPSKASKAQQPAPKGDNNLRAGRVLPAGHVWKPSTDWSEVPSHFGAPGHLKEAEQRYPPRPQNRKHYMMQIQTQRNEEAKHKKAASGLPAKKGTSKSSDNLRKFNEKFGPAKSGNGAGKAHEAPARMRADHPTSHTIPSSPLPQKPPSPQHPSRPSSHRPPSKPPVNSKKPRSK